MYLTRKRKSAILSDCFTVLQEHLENQTQPNLRKFRLAILSTSENYMASSCKDVEPFIDNLYPFHDLHIVYGLPHHVLLTTQRLATLSKPGSQASLGSGSSTASTPSRSVSGQGVSRVTQPTASSLQRAAERQADAHSLARSSDTSLRSRGAALPTIAGSPSVGTITKNGEGGANTKIPRIHSRTSTVTSPALSKSTRR